MEAKQTTKKRSKKLTANERYLNAMFTLLKQRDSLVLTGKHTQFNDTELRLIGEVLSAGTEGKRLISTQLAVRLGVTRSAISQIVNRLEGQGVIVRVPDARDKKIAYVEIAESTLRAYQKEINACAAFAGDVVKAYGEEKFERLCALFGEFMTCVGAKKEEYESKTKKK